MSETSLHYSLKDYYAGNDGTNEVIVDGYSVDVIKGNIFYEIQTKHFYSLKPKLKHLITYNPVRVIYPVALKRWIIVYPENGNQPIRKRKSPKKGRLELIFNELIYIPDLLSHPNLSIEIIFITEEEIRKDDGKGSWRRKRVSIVDRKLVSIESTRKLQYPYDYLNIVPYDLSYEFSNKELAKSLKIPIPLARKITYCLRSMNLIRITNKSGNTLLYKKEKYNT